MSRIVIVDDEAGNVAYMSRVLSGHTLVSFTDPREALVHCRTQEFDIIVADQKMPHLGGVDLISQIRENRNSFLSIIVSAYTDSEDLVAAVNSNLIYKYVVKPFSPESLQQHVARATDYLELQRSTDARNEAIRRENSRLMDENGRLRGEHPPLDDFVGFAPPILHLKQMSGFYADSDRPLLISGETGTGKELLARAMHQLSSRRDHRFVVLNSAALPDHLIESELFGYQSGAFTGADTAKPGLVSIADGGTLFLDEVGELSSAAQAKLLRVIQFGTYFPLGGIKEQRANFRLVCATNRELRTSVLEGTFREDLFYRIAALELMIPPLRERREDVLPVMRSIALNAGIALPRLTKEAARRLEEHDYPGNVRELENIVSKIDLLSRGHGIPELDADHIESILPRTESSPERPSQPTNIHEAVAAFEKQLVADSLARNDGNISQTARELGLSRQGLRNKLQAYELNQESA